jgi:hypothetical protein
MDDKARQTRAANSPVQLLCFLPCPVRGQNGHQDTESGSPTCRERREFFGREVRGLAGFVGESAGGRGRRVSQRRFGQRGL